MPHSPLDMTPIRLSDGWSGHGAVKNHGLSSWAALPSRLPTIEQWRAQLDRLTTDPSRLPGYQVLKYGKDGAVFRAYLEVDGNSLGVIVKRTRPRGLIGCLAAGLGRSRARRNFTRALTLLDAGVNTAFPLAVIERARPHPEALLLTAYVDDLTDLDDIALRRLPYLPARDARRIKQGLIERIADLIVRLERLGLTHRDFKASNILVEGLHGWASSTGTADTDRTLNVWLVDLDGLGRCRWRRTARRWQPMIRLAASLLGYSAVTRTDYARFLRCYLAQNAPQKPSPAWGVEGWARGKAIGRRPLADGTIIPVPLPGRERGLYRRSWENLPREGWRRCYRGLADRAAEYARRANRRKVHKLDGFTADG